MFAVEEVEQKLRIIQDQEEVRNINTLRYGIHVMHTPSRCLQVIAQMRRNVSTLQEQVLALKRVTGKPKSSPRKQEAER